MSDLFRCGPSVCWLTVTAVGAAGSVIIEQEVGTEDVSRLRFCSKSFFTVGRVQHGFSFGADEGDNEGMASVNKYITNKVSITVHCSAEYLRFFSCMHLHCPTYFNNMHILALTRKFHNAPFLFVES